MQNLRKSKIFLAATIMLLKVHQPLNCLILQHQIVKFSRTSLSFEKYSGFGNDDKFQNQENVKNSAKKIDVGGKNESSETLDKSVIPTLATAMKSAMTDIVQHIEKLSHMDDVRQAQTKVLKIKDDLKLIRDNKREIIFELIAVRESIQIKHTEICNSKRGTDRYLKLMNEEMALLKFEKMKNTQFSKFDSLERELFDDLTTAINDSYEKERIYTNFIKIFGSIGAVLASIVTLTSYIMGHFYFNTKYGSDMNKLKNTLRSQENLIKKLSKQVSNESWAGYFKRHTVNCYRYFYPAK